MMLNWYFLRDVFFSISLRSDAGGLGWPVEGRSIDKRLGGRKQGCELRIGCRTRRSGFDSGNPAEFKLGSSAGCTQENSVASDDFAFFPHET